MAIIALETQGPSHYVWSAMERPQSNDIPQIAVVGSINRDTVLRARSIPQPGETVLGISQKSSRGGKGANQAIAAARLGCAVSMIGRVGADADGPGCLGALAAEGVDVDGVGVDVEASTGHATVIVDDNAENAIVVIPGANAMLGPSEVRAAGAALRDAAVTLLQLEVPLDAVQEAMSLATGTIILNPAPAQRIPAPLLAQVGILVPNRLELAYLSGRSPASDIEGVIAQAHAIPGPEAIVVTLGGQGAVLVSERGALHVAAFPVDAVDTTGAGDAFCGGLADAVARGVELDRAVQWAAAVGAIATTRSGAQAALPNRDQVLEAVGS